MSDALNHVNEIAPELLKAICDVLTAGYGEVVIRIADFKVDVIEKKITVKVKK